MVVGQPANALTGPGKHDLYLVVRGVYVGLEVKTSTGRATKIQLDRLRRTRQAGGWSWIVRSTWGAVHAARLAFSGPPKKEHMADDFDIDKLLSSFRSNEKEPPAPPPLEPTPFDNAEAEIAARALANGTAAGDGVALGESPTITEMLASSIRDLAQAVGALATAIAFQRGMEAARDEAQAATDGEESEPTSEAAPPVERPKRSPRARRS